MNTYWLVYTNFGMGLQFLIVSFVLLLFCFLRGKRNKIKENHLFSKTLKTVKWTPTKLPIVDGLITPLKLKAGGIKAVADVLFKHGMNCRMPLLLYEIIAISDPYVVKKVLSSKHVGHLSKPRFFYDLVFADFLKNGLLASTTDIWSLHRKAIVEAFNYNAFPTYLKYINEGAKTMLNLAVSESVKFGSDGIVENSKMQPIIHQCALQIVTHMILGEDFTMLSQESLKGFQQTHQKWKTIMLERILNPPLLLAPIWKFHPKRLQMDSHIADLLRFEYNIVDSYRSRLHSNALHGQSLNSTDILENTPNCQDNVKENFQCMVERMINAGMSNKEIADEIGTFMLAGHESIVVAIEMLSFQLARYPEHQKRCQEEIDRLYSLRISDHNNKDLELDELSELKYLERCILECLRLSPPAPLFLRQLEAPLEVENGLFLEVGEIVMISPWMVHRNPTFYPNPEVFDPDRFLPENVKTRPTQAFIPFSMGPRNCVGWKVAMIEMKVLMANILRNFCLITEDNPDDVKILFDVTLKPERPYNIHFIKRDL